MHEWTDGETRHPRLDLGTDSRNNKVDGLAGRGPIWSRGCTMSLTHSDGTGSGCGQHVVSSTSRVRGGCSLPLCGEVVLHYIRRVTADSPSGSTDSWDIGLHMHKELWRWVLEEGGQVTRLLRTLPRPDHRLSLNSMPAVQVWRMEGYNLVYCLFRPRIVTSLLYLLVEASADPMSR
jgi:hypothetical protein